MEDARVLKDKGNQLFNLGKVSESIIEYSKAITVSDQLPARDVAIIFSNRSLAYTVLRPADTTKALEDAMQAISLSPDWWKGHTRAAQIYKSTDDLKNAVKFYRTALELNPGDEEIKNHLHVSLMQKAIKNIDPKYLTRTVDECIESIVKGSEEANVEETKKKLMAEESESGYLVKGHFHRMEGEYKKAGEFFLKSADMGNLEAKYNLALLKVSEKLGKSIIGEVIQLLEEIADSMEMSTEEGDIGKAESEFLLGLYNEEVTNDYSKAMSYYQLAKERGHGLAANNLGFMLSKGIGGPSNKEEAVKCWEFAGNSKHQVIQSMEILVQHYLLTENRLFSVAYHWFKKSTECGNERLLAKQPGFLVDVDTLVQWKFKMEHLVKCHSEEYEKCQEAASLKIRMDSKIAEMIGFYFPPEDIDQNLEDQPSDINGVMDDRPKHHTLATPRPGYVPSEKEKLITELNNSLQAGNVWVQSLLDADRHFTNAMNLLPSLDKRCTKPLATEFLKGMARAICLESSFLTLTPGSVWKIKSIVDHMMARTPVNEVSELDKNLLICQTFVTALLDPKDFDHLLLIAKKGMKKYPQEFYFLDVVCMMYTHKQLRSKVIQEVKKGRKIFPNHHRLMYITAVAECEMSVSHEKKRKNFLEYIKYAPIGHRFIPEAYYRISYLFIAEFDDKLTVSKFFEGRKFFETLTDVEKYYKMGMEKEKSVVSWYLPYQSGSRDLVEGILEAQGIISAKA